MQKMIHPFKERIAGFRYDRNEIAGALGDMGTFIPFFIGVIVVCGLSPGAVLFMFGLFHAITGIMFAIPMSVQPMKAIGAIAITEGLTPAEIAAAGIITGVILLGLSFYGIKILEKIPLSIIRGIQLGLGLTLSMKGLEYIVQKPFFGYDSIILGIFTCAIALLLLNNKKIPAAIVIFSLGVVIATITNIENISVNFNFINFEIVNPDFNFNAYDAAIAQIPLTIGNSIIATIAFASSTFSRKVSIKSLTRLLGVMNITAPMLGGMPMCHGAGGIAAQYRFGARTGGSMLMLGIGMMLLGVFFGESILNFITHFPLSILGVFLFFAGLELTLQIRDVLKKDMVYVMIFTALVYVVAKAAIALVCGIILVYLIKKGILKL